MAAILPNPITRSARSPGPGVRRLAGNTLRGPRRPERPLSQPESGLLTPKFKEIDPPQAPAPPRFGRIHPL